MSGRFAPSTTGPAHPGTLLAALLCWLDARSRGERVGLRLEDLDPERCTSAHAEAMIAALSWFGLDWDGIVHQHRCAAAHEAALDALAAQGALYPCPATRGELAGIGRLAPDGAVAYDNRSRARTLPAGGWRACSEPLRARLPDGVFSAVDEGGLDLAQDPAAVCGDPVVRRRDGAVAYQLAVVVDDAAAGVDRVVRGRDIAPSTATQAALQQLLGLPTPRYRHHLLLLEERGRKLAKLHGAVGAPVLARRYSAPELCGLLAGWSGIAPTSAPCTPASLVAGFSWDNVRGPDVVVRWTGSELITVAQP
jgi:glutamyl/glutaminyl-tRNA synthetase